ncbi:hypothetical protein M2149_000446 [Lachnospiraceae bacterium PFB1-21]|nr:hypothetical protein [Lachnospiraceae bacterium OttesenSCG-928-J05]
MPLSTKTRLLSLLLVGVLFLGGCGRSDEAADYVEAILDLTFQGDVKKALSADKETTRADLQALYEENIDSFVYDNITGQLEEDGSSVSHFADVVKDIYRSQRYRVISSQRTGTGAYEVEVEIEPTDAFLLFQEQLTEDGKRLGEKAQTGGYTGSDEQIEAQIKRDILNHAYDFLYAAQLDSSYAKKERITLRVSRKDGTYEINEKDMHEFTVQILRLDEIQ